MFPRFEAVLSLLIWVQPALAASQQPDEAGPFHPTIAAAPPPDCEARVGYDRDMTLPGYLLPTQ